MTGRRPLRTIDLARAARVHVNTVHLYERLGLIAPARRAPNGYRCFAPEHLRQMCLARLVLEGPWPGRRIRRSAFQLARTGASGDRRRTASAAREHLALVREERARAERAAGLVARWARADGEPRASRAPPMAILAAATEVGVTPDAVRNWERNGLIRSARMPGNRYRTFDSRILGRMRVIAMLRDAGYGLLAILRLLRAHDRGERMDARRMLDAPDDLVSAAGAWLTTLEGAEDRARRVLALARQRAT